MTADAFTVGVPSDATAVLRELRTTRKRRRLGDLDWYEIAYRVYLFALVGLVTVVWVSDAIDGAIGDTVDTDALLTRGPSVIGLFVVVAFALGVRSGADGGPIAVEVADIRHVLLAPISRRTFMLRPIGQRLRSAAFALGLGGAVLGQLIATEVEGSRAAWAAACAAAGAITGATFVSAAVLSHAWRIPRAVATAIAGGAVGWQALVAWGIWNERTEGLARLGPGNLVGRLALWGISQRAIDLVAVAIAVAMAAAALAYGGRLRLEPLARRGELVSQLRFAATVQDLRTVVQLRRQLRSEVFRTRPWGRDRTPPRPAPTGTVRRSAPSPTRRVSARIVWARSARSLRRLPVARLGRIVLLAALAGVGGVLTYQASPLFGLLLLGALFLLGLESLEPLSQEIDRPDLTDGYAIDRGWIYAHLLAAPAALLAGAALVGAGAAAAVEPSLALGALLIAVPVAWAGAMGGVVVTVLDAPTTPSATTLLGLPRDEATFVPPEFAGFSSIVRAALPVMIGAVGTAPVFVARFTQDAAGVGRSILGLALFIGVVVLWVRRRDPWTTRTREFFEAGRAAQS
ncbi:MAG TPA: hypothetical protein VK853_05565 [Ilumatobacteraceae bacterium]|nr:hypothetical protein [Ilumatobacteraceae bacterium]